MDQPRITARLRTACGATRDIEMDRLAASYRVPIMRWPHRAVFLNDEELLKLPGTRYREFLLDGQEYFQGHIFAEYRERVVE